MSKDTNGVVRIGELALYKLDDIQHEIKKTYRKRIPKKELLGLAIDCLKTHEFEEKFKTWILNYKSKK